MHLGILRTELRGKPYERFFRWELDPLPDHVEQVLRQGEAKPSDVLPRSDVNRLLEPGYLPLETGWASLSDGTSHVAVLTRFPGATGEMIDWWFGWHGAETERYKLWHPQAHLFTQLRYERSDVAGLSDRQKYIGNTSYVDEYVGPAIHRLAISFHEPRDFGLAEHSFKEAGVSTAICARVGFSDRPVDTGYLVHLIRETPEGCEMRSRFWIGEVRVRNLREGNPIDRVLGTRFARRSLIPRRLSRDLLVHCAEEMNHLASFLPELFAREAGTASPAVETTAE
ncbi:MAG: hypothetical protein JRH01_05935 [Deltaproteobacteria bacterium]|nr:hypothetical protein [Deltaproteobacteria bacterium]MBW2397173.1 hypothetical protein [Deltaproteobacteria bacterium]